ncbi:E3 ubiquitin-protein ligase MARCHF8-like [Ylistrum balloti]|uniref:E3 ubiquitin-protein ligase MARCHF8-like n=1 Tax=Ylistrum balloti TaxID=509963 RepID=UPI002905DB37|nr:E3 ubiquitin-protein ligase MARCHF8-like [Ylistrum balloti]XP_060084985.1 E3 ubiquitin-protein ligase MARCHF8-like [Ylistrum balloti]
MKKNSEEMEEPDFNVLNLAQVASSNLTVASIHTIGTVSMSSANLTPLPQKKLFYSREASVTGTDLLPICRICQLPGDIADPLFSPCRCSGTLGFIHYTCLKRWIDISTRKTKKQPRCELCHYQFHRHKRFKFKNWRWPKVNTRDKILHIIFFLNLLIMIGCAIATVMCFLSDKGQITKFPKNKVELTLEEIITLACGVMFFVAFFIAMTVEIKAKHTVYKLCMKFIVHNTEWNVDSYDRSKDSGLKVAPQYV